MKSFLAAVLLAVVTMFAAPVSRAQAATMEARVHLHDGKLSTADLSRALLDNFHLNGFELDAGDIDMSGIGGWTFVRSLNAALGEGCHVRVDDDALVLSVDPQKLPRSIDSAKKSIRVFTTNAAPKA